MTRKMVKRNSPRTKTNNKSPSIQKGNGVRRPTTKKGESAASNPTSMKHRNNAKLKRLIGKYPLIAVEDRPQKDELLLQHISMDSINLDAKAKDKIPRKHLQSELSDENDQMSLVSGKASNFTRTELTQFTNCTNPTFDPVHREWRSGSKLQSEVLTVLAACAEIIQQNEGSESDVEYFATLLSFLEATNPEQLEKIAAISYLLRLNAGKVSPAILIRTFGQSSKIILERIEQIAHVAQEASEKNHAFTALKFLVSTLGTVFKVQPLSIWDVSNKSILVSVFLKLSGEAAPHVRAAACRALVSILTDSAKCSQTGNCCHPASKFVGEAIHQALAQQKASLAAKDIRTRRSLIGRLLSLLEELLYKIPKPVFQTLMEDVLQLASTTATDIGLRCSAFRCIYKTLLLQPSEEHSLPLGIALETTEFLQSAQPRAADREIIPFWIKALVESYVYLETQLTTESPLISRSKADQLLSETVKIICRLFRNFPGATDQNTVLVELVTSLGRLIESICQEPRKSQTWTPFFLEQLDSALNPQNTTVWPFVIRCIESLFESAKLALIGPTFSRIMSTYAEFRDKDNEFVHVNAFDQLFGFAVRYLGPEPVLSAVSLGLDPEAPVLPQNFQRSWLLPTLSGNLRNAPLALFSQTLLPLAMRLHQRLPQIPVVATRKLYGVVEHQLWAYLPKCLVSKPPDFEQQFPPLAPILGAALNERADLRQIVLSSLRATLQLAKETESSPVREVLERFAKNFMPILFGLYTADGTRDESRQNTPQKYAVISAVDNQNVQAIALDIVRLYSTFAPSPLIQQYVRSALEKIQDPANSHDKKLRILDILVALSSAIDSATAMKIFAVIQPYFQPGTDGSLQKKAYRFLSELSKRICEPSLQNFFSEYHIFFEEELPLIGVHTVAGHSRPWRMAFWRNLVKSMAIGSTFKQLSTFVKMILPEVVGMLGPGSTKSRAQAGHCLQDICESLINISEKEEVTPSGALSVVLSTVYTLSSSCSDCNSEAFRSTLIALNIVTQRYLRVMNASLTGELVSQATKTITTVRDVSVRLVAIRLLRIICQKAQDFVFEQYKELLLTAIFSQPVREESSGKKAKELSNQPLTSVKLRKANSLLLGVLIERVGLEPLLRVASEVSPRKATAVAWQKQLKNLDKIRRRSAKKKSIAAAKNMTEAGETEKSGQKRKKREKSDEKKSAASTVSRLSLATTAKTAGADSIFGLLDAGDEDELLSSGDEDFIESMRVRNQQRKNAAGVVLVDENSEDDEPLDLLDRNQTLRRMTTAGAAQEQAKKDRRKKSDGNGKDEEEGPFKTNAEGRLLITDLDAEERKKAKHSAAKRVRFASEDDDGEGSSDDDDSDDGPKDQFGDDLEEGEEDDNALGSDDDDDGELGPSGAGMDSDEEEEEEDSGDSDGEEDDMMEED